MISIDSLPSGIAGYAIILLCVLIGYIITNSNKVGVHIIDRSGAGIPEEEEEDIEPLRNFTQTQLLYFDGKDDESTLEPKSIYLSLNGTVFDVSKGRDFYGPNGPYALFAGHECGVALAKMSFDTEFLDDFEGCKNLNFGEKDELDNWMAKFEHYRSYPIKGRLIPNSLMPDPQRILSIEELGRNNGKGEIPQGYAAAPIYIGAEDKVFDMSFGGVTFYGPDCSYAVFAGRDATRNLALMSLKEEDALNPDVSDLDEKKIKIMRDWKSTFEERKKYPVVGRLAK